MIQNGTAIFISPALAVWIRFEICSNLFFILHSNLRQIYSRKIITSLVYLLENLEKNRLFQQAPMNYGKKIVAL